MSENNPEVSPHEDKNSKPDVISDPALNDELGQDWTDEGGATSAGAALDESDNE